MGHTTHIKLVLGMLKAIRVLDVCKSVFSCIFIHLSLSLAHSHTHVHLYGFKEVEHAMASNLNTSPILSLP